jgi:metallophosphoesterase (TIGR00282 family)
VVQLPPPPPDGHDRILLVGDIVGKPGTKLVCQAARWLKERLHLSALIVNAENSADGSGLTLKDYNRLIQNGVDVITLGDHIYRKREIMEVLQSQANIVRPANFPNESIGRCWAEFELPSRRKLIVVSLMGRVFMKPVDCPFHAVDRVLKQVLTSDNLVTNNSHTQANSASTPSQRPLILIDFHAEATSDKQALGRYLDGRVTAVLGTHTHVTTADEQILPGGTAFQCDVGMTGAFHSILGRQIEPVLEATLTFSPISFSVATEDVRLSATWVDACSTTGKATAIGRIMVKEADLEA